MTKISIKKLSLKTVLMLVSIVALANILYNSIDFPDHSYFFKGGVPSNEYTNVNVFNGVTNFLYITDIFTSLSVVYFIVDFVYYLITKKDFLPKLLVCVVINEIFVTLGYCLFAVISKSDWGLYNTTPSAWHNFGGNIYIHVVYPVIVMLTMFVGAKDNDTQMNKRKLYLSYGVFAIIYWVVVKVLGETAYSFRWFPYPIFSTDGIWQVVFGSQDNYNMWLALLILIGIYLVLVGIFYLVSILVIKWYDKKEKRM